jgi:phosphoribosylformylglycinamidine cyclo-ligase
MESHSDIYKNAGVDVTAGYAGVELIKALAKKTRDAQARNSPEAGKVLGGIGDFGGYFAPKFSAFKEPVLVSGADGVGTKLKIAFALNRHDTVGIDCVAMCVNDLLCSGAAPLFVLDYIAFAKNDPQKVAAIVSGVAEGCVQSGAALLGADFGEGVTITASVKVADAEGLMARVREASAGRASAQIIDNR